MSCDLYSISSSQLKSQLAGPQAVIDKAVNLGDDIPVLGSNIKDTGKVVDQFATQLSDKIASFPQDTTEADIKAGLISVLHAAPLNILSDRNSDGQYESTK